MFILSFHIQAVRSSLLIYKAPWYAIITFIYHIHCVFLIFHNSRVKTNHQFGWKNE